MDIKVDEGRVRDLLSLPNFSPSKDGGRYWLWFDADGTITNGGDDFPFTYGEILREAEQFGWAVGILTGRSRSQCDIFIEEAERVGIPTVVLYENGAFGMRPNGVLGGPPHDVPFFANEDVLSVTTQVRELILRWSTEVMKPFMADKGIANTAVSFFGNELVQAMYSLYILNTSRATPEFLQVEAGRLKGRPPERRLHHDRQREEMKISDSDGSNLLSRLSDSLDRFLTEHLGQLWHGGGCMTLSDSAILVGYHSLLHKGAVLEVLQEWSDGICFVGDGRNDLPGFRALKKVPHARCVAVEYDGTPHEILALADHRIPGKGQGALAISEKVLRELMIPRGGRKR